MTNTVPMTDMVPTTNMVPVTNMVPTTTMVPTTNMVPMTNMVPTTKRSGLGRKFCCVVTRLLPTQTEDSRVDVYSYGPI